MNDGNGLSQAVPFYWLRKGRVFTGGRFFWVRQGRPSCYPQGGRWGKYASAGTKYEYHEMGAPMNDFSFYSPTRIVFGKNALESIGSELGRIGCTKALIVYGGGSARAAGTLDRVEASLNAAGIAHVELGGVRPNPEITLVREGVELARFEKVDVIVPVGGGSVMDTAKAIALGAVYNGDVWDFFVHRATPTERIPVAAVPTLPASGSEASNSSVISNDAEHLKCGINTDLNRPVAAFMDPKLTYTLPPYQTAAGAVDIISHAMERFFSGEPAVPVTDHIACGIIRSVIECAPRALAQPDDYDARANLMWAGTLAHNGLAGCGVNVPGSRDGDWTCHGLEHELSALDTSITHGAGLAVIFPAWMRYVWREHPERFLTFAREVFDIEAVDGSDEAIEDAVTATIDELQEFFVSLGMPRTLGAFDVHEDDIERMIPGLTLNRGEVFGSFKQLTLDDARAIFRSAL